MIYDFMPLNKEYASIISKWQYNEPYSLYSMDGTNECISELMSKEYFYTLDQEGHLVGFICYGNSARVPGGYDKGIYKDKDYLDIGLGLAPEYTGKGIGLDITNQCMIYFGTKFSIKKFRLVVATFNQRAIKVYERVGFIKGEKFKSKVSNNEMEFMVMRISV
jgi:ribosomal-protein-alanine N-acetyltransferase